MKKSSLLITSLIFLSASTSAWANCPNPSDVEYGCSIVYGKKHCNWSAPWYEGFPEDSAQQNDKASSFIRAYWTTASGIPPEPGYLGSTVCFYKSPYGNEIHLVQNNWGNVDYPAGSNWKEGYWEGLKGRECTAGASLCQFNYPI